MFRNRLTVAFLLSLTIGAGAALLSAPSTAHAAAFSGCPDTDCLGALACERLADYTCSLSGTSCTVSNCQPN